MTSTAWIHEPLSTEISGAKLGDPRRSRRFEKIVERLAESPKQSFPQAFSSPAEQEGFYRFLRSEHFTWTDMLAPHVEKTLGRATECGECLVLHDTTQFSFSSKRADLGLTASTAHGFMGHFSLVVTADGARVPLGVAAVELFTRKERKGKSRFEHNLKNPNNESLRWERGVEAVEAGRDGNFEAIHVADREGDIFPFFSKVIDAGSRFVVRVCRERRILDEQGEELRLGEALLTLRPRTKYEIQVGSRGKPLNPKMGKIHPSRHERFARVSLAATTVTVPLPTKRGAGEALEMNLVRVWEENPPKGQPGVEWFLWTSEPVDTIAEMKQVVEYYRARWVIEEYFKALKTGCSFEERQLESMTTLSSALAAFVPIAWRLLLMRSVARAKSQAPAAAVLSPLQITYLAKKFGKPIRTADDALLATAQLGGHIKRNGQPGWQTLARGYEQLLLIEEIAQTLQVAETCDQS